MAFGAYHWQYDSARIFDADAEGLEDLDLRVVSVAAVILSVLECLESINKIDIPILGTSPIVISGTRRRLLIPGPRLRSRRRRRIRHRSRRLAPLTARREPRPSILGMSITSLIMPR